MALSGFLSAGLKQSLENLFPVTLVYYIPTESNCTATGCGYNAFTRSGLNPSCTVCGGLGKTTVWSLGYVRCRAIWVDDAVLHVHQGLVAGRVGDVQIQGKLRDKATYELLMNTDRAYILFDDRKVKPRSVTVNKVERQTSLDVRCDEVRDE